MLDPKEIALGIKQEHGQVSLLQQFLGGGFRRAIISGAGFGIGDDIINKIL
jgi:hypothetical protein